MEWILSLDILYPCLVYICTWDILSMVYYTYNYILTKKRGGILSQLGLPDQDYPSKKELRCIF